MSGLSFRRWRPTDRAAVADLHDRALAGFSAILQRGTEAPDLDDVEGNYLKMFELAPAFAERIGVATRVERIVGTAVPNYFATPYGPGWALVGDAGYNKDFITAQGITDAFRDAELCAGAIDQAMSGTRSFESAMRDYQQIRDAHVLPMFEFTCQLAALEPPSPELAQLLAAIDGNQAEMDGFARLNAGVTSPAEYFAPPNVERIMALVGAVAPA